MKHTVKLSFTVFAIL